MSYILTLANQKGGVGKTTTAVNLAAFLGKKKKKVLVIDLDPQGNATSGLGINKGELEGTIYDVIVNDVDIKDTIWESSADNVWICPTNINLAGAEIELVNVMSREQVLKNAIKPIKGEYDYIIIDCPPSLSILTINALTASDGIVIPIQGEYYALEGVSQLIHTINLVRDRLNPELNIDGVVFNMYDGRTNLSQQVVDNVKNNLSHHIYDIRNQFGSLCRCHIIDFHHKIRFGAC